MKTFNLLSLLVVVLSIISVAFAGGNSTSCGGGSRICILDGVGECVTDIIDCAAGLLTCSSGAQCKLIDGEPRCLIQIIDSALLPICPTGQCYGLVSGLLQCVVEVVDEVVDTVECALSCLLGFKCSVLNGCPACIRDSNINSLVAPGQSCADGKHVALLDGIICCVDKIINYVPQLVNGVLQVITCPNGAICKLINGLPVCVVNFVESYLLGCPSGKHAELVGGLITCVVDTVVCALDCLLGHECHLLNGAPICLPILDTLLNTINDLTRGLTCAAGKKISLINGIACCVENIVDAVVNTVDNVVDSLLCPCYSSGKIIDGVPTCVFSLVESTLLGCPSNQYPGLVQGVVGCVLDIVDTVVCDLLCLLGSSCKLVNGIACCVGSNGLLGGLLGGGL